MASPNHTRDNDNYYRFNRLVVDIGTSVLRRLLEVKVSLQAADVDTFLQISRVRLKLKRLCPDPLKQNQLDLLYPPGGGAVDLYKWDITMICCVLTNVGKLSKEERTKVMAIRDIRNNDAHAAQASMDNATYTTEWTHTINIINDLLAFCNDAGFQTETNKFIDFVKNEREADVYQLRVDTWTNDEAIFVETLASKKIKELVENQNIVTIGGNSGSGKSAIAHHVALSYASQGYTVLPVSRAEEIKQLGNVKEQQVFVIDDPVGKHQLDHQELQLYERYYDDLNTLVKAGIKMIFTCRTYICRDKDFKSQTTVIRDNVVDLHDGDYRLTTTERLAILKKHLTVSGLSPSEEEVDLIASKQYSNYPFLCKMFASHASFRKLGIEFFEKPIDILRKEIDCIHKMKYCALVLCMMFSDRAEVDMFNPFHVKYTETKQKVKQIMQACDLDKTVSRTNILNEFETLVGTFLIKEGSHFQFVHDIIYDVTALHFSNRYPCVVLEHASSNFIREYVRVERSDDDINHVVLIDEIDFPILARRLVTDITDGFLFNVFQNPLFQNRTVHTELQKYISNMTQSGIYDMAIKCKPTLTEEEIAKHVNAQSLIYKHIAILYELFHNGAGVMHWLLAFGYIDLFREIFQRLSIPDEEWGTLPSTQNLLPFACLSGDLEIVEMLFHKGNHGNITIKNENSAVMHMAVLSGNPNVLKYISKREPVVNTATCYDLTPLQLIGLNDTMRGEDVKKMIRLILDLGIDINQCNYRGMNPVYIAATAGNLDVVHVLLDNGGNVNQCKENGISPVFVASQNGHADVVRELLENGGTVNQIQENGISPVYIASQNGHVDVVRVLLGKGGNVNQCQESGISPLFAASHEGHVDVVRVLLDNGGNVNQCQKNGVSPVFIASQEGHVDVVRVLLDNGGNVNQCQENGISPLYIASEHGHVDVVRVLLGKSGNVNQCQENGISPLFVASQNGHVDVVRVLLGKGGNVNQCHENGISPLFIASQNGHAYVVRVLLGNGGNVNQCKENGVSPLFIASQNGHVDMVRVLLGNGGNVNQCQENGVTPLFVASHNGHVDVVRVLLDNGGNVNQCQKNGVTPLSVASHDGHVDVVRVLLDNGGNVNQCHENGVSPLFTASHNGHVDVVRVLLDNGGNVNQCLESGISPLFIASQEGHVDVVRVLLDNDGNVNQCKENGVSPLFIASHNGHVDVVRVLLDNGGNVNQCKKNGVSPLFIASHNGHVDVVRVLLDNGGNVNQCLENGVSPLFIASHNGHVDVVRVLLDNSGNVNQCKENGVSPLFVASQNGHVDVVRVLLDNDGNVNQFEDSIATPLLVSSRQGHIHVVRALLDRGADIALYDIYNTSPLCAASHMGHLDVVRTLIDQGADINASNIFTASPLTAASMMGHADVVFELIQHGGNVNMPTINGFTPLAAASDGKHYNIVIMLIKHGAIIHHCNVLI